MSKKQTGAGRANLVFKVFKDHETNWIFQRTLGLMGEKGAELKECLYTATKINERDVESWIKEWANMADIVERHAEASLSNGHLISARECYLRASNYYRTAEYGCVPAHPRFFELWDKSRRCFHKACPLFTPPIEIIEVPFQGKKLPGYYWRPDSSEVKRPTLISVGGNDSSGEEIWFWTGPAAIRRGYNYFTFEFPGHRGAVHLYPELIKRPDQEVPFKAAIDYLEMLPGVDERIALTGISHGGYVVSRVAVHEKRVKAVIPNSPLVDAYQAGIAVFGGGIEKVPDMLIDMIGSWKLKRSPLIFSVVEYMKWTLGCSKLSELVKSTIAKEMNISNELYKIVCPALILVGEDEGDELLKQAKQFYDGISSAIKEMHVFRLRDDGTEDHCQVDNRSRGNQVMFDWLDTVFNYKFP